MATEVILNEQFALTIYRGDSSTTYEYKPVGYWSEVITAKIGKDFGVKELGIEFSNSSGGSSGELSEVEQAKNFVAAYMDAIERSQRDFETECARIKKAERDEALRFKREQEEINRLYELELEKYECVDEPTLINLVNTLEIGFGVPLGVNVRKAWFTSNSPAPEVETVILKRISSRKYSIFNQAKHLSKKEVIDLIKSKEIKIYRKK